MFVRSMRGTDEGLPTSYASAAVNGIPPRSIPAEGASSPASLSRASAPCLERTNSERNSMKTARVLNSTPEAFNIPAARGYVRFPPLVVTELDATVWEEAKQNNFAARALETGDLQVLADGGRR